MWLISDVSFGESRIIEQNSNESCLSLTCPSTMWSTAHIYPDEKKTVERYAG
jgi:hypothetical protein